MMKRKYLLVVMMLVALCSLSLSVSGSAAPAAAVHSVWSQKPLYVRDAITGQMYTATSGNAVASWTTEPLASGDKGFYDAIVYANSTRYEFRLVKFAGSTLDQIDGVFDIYKNNVKVATVNGFVYGLSQPAGVGNYYKFYDSSYQWHVSGYITSRIDF